MCTCMSRSSPCVCVCVCVCVCRRLISHVLGCRTITISTLRADVELWSHRTHAHNSHNKTYQTLRLTLKFFLQSCICGFSSCIPLPHPCCSSVQLPAVISPPSFDHPLFLAPFFSSVVRPPSISLPPDMCDPLSLTASPPPVLCPPYFT